MVREASKTKGMGRLASRMSVDRDDFEAEYFESALKQISCRKLSTTTLHY